MTRMNDDTIYIGIDPGLSGSIAILKNDQLSVHRMPTAPVVRGRRKTRQIDTMQLATLLRDACKDHDQVAVGIEDVHAMPGQGVTSMFNFGVVKGICAGICAGLNLPYRFVSPRTWKRSWNLERQKKEAARHSAQKIFPGVKFKRVDDADAALIALWVKMNWQRLLEEDGKATQKKARKRKRTRK